MNNRWDYDPQESGPQYLENLATGYWFSQVLFTALEAGVFDYVAKQGKTAAELALALGWDSRATGRFLEALVSLGLLTRDGVTYYNTRLASRCLVKGGEEYQGNSILWRKELQAGWGELQDCLRTGGRVSYLPDDRPEQLEERVRRYIMAMDDVARFKVREFLPIFRGALEEGLILDVGAGSGAISAGFLEAFPATRATLLDLEHVLMVTRSLMEAKGLLERARLQPANILEPWPVPQGSFQLVLLSNIVHAYSEAEIPEILQRAADCLAPEGYLLIHDFFPEHYPAKAGLLDLNMLINTYNGRIFPENWTSELLNQCGLVTTNLVPLPSDTALIIASRSEAALARLNLDPVARLAARLRTLGFREIRPIAPDLVQVADWTDLRCRYGCNRYGRGHHCPPESPDQEKTRAVLRQFSQALLLEGEPPTRDFQKKALEAERLAFKAGYHKAFVYWAGPCSLCRECSGAGACRRPQDARPAMEASGIDVYATVRRAGFQLKTLADRGEYARYFALLLLE